MPGQAIIVVGASAGGVEALLTLAGVLPPDLPAAVLVVLHTSARPSALPRLLGRRGPLPADQATDGAPLQPGRIYVAPGEHHLLVARGHLHVVQGPQENGFCPAVDPLFRSAAKAYGPHVIGVILSGHLDDGTAGLLAVKRHGGLAVVQDPDEAFAPGMPRSALAYVAVDYTLPLASMGPLLGRLAAVVAEAAEHMPDDAPEMASADHGVLDVTDGGEGTPAPFSCPACGGVLSEVRDGGLVCFRCQVGHRFSPESIAADQQAALGHTLWRALTALNERVLLLQHLAREARRRRDPLARRRFEAQARAAEVQKEQMRQVLRAVTEAGDDTGDERPPYDEARP
jgi:two-component system chemotaxis response regulator CheB